MARHRTPGGRQPSPALEEALHRASSRARGTHRIPSPPSALRGRIVVAAVAAGAFAAATAGQLLQSDDQSGDERAPLADGTDVPYHMGGSGGAAPDVLAIATPADPSSLEVKKITKSERVNKAREAHLRALRAEANRPKFVRPADGVFTSGFGYRWGTTHYGIDIANSMGTPIVAAADGTVIEAGPANGFGLWVRIQHDDGTVTVYGHVDTYSVYEGQRVKAGDQIARMGNRGYSTGPHLHFEVWDAYGRKIDPQGWLASHGIAY